MNLFKKNSISLIILFAATLIFSSCASNYKIIDASSWTLVYENDKDGKTINGDIKNLINAIRNGKEVRIVLSAPELDYAAAAEILWIKNDIVYMQNSSHISCSFQDEQLVFHEDAYNYFYIINTNGDRQTSRWLIGEHTSKGDSYDKVGVKWFVK